VVRNHQATEKIPVYLNFCANPRTNSLGPIRASIYTIHMIHSILPRLISSIVSLVQASTLRDRYYTALNRIEILETAIEDIGRINNHGAKDPLIKGITDRIR
jgi:hypothetical protein